MLGARGDPPLVISEWKREVAGAARPLLVSPRGGGKKKGVTELLIAIETQLIAEMAGRQITGLGQ